MSLKITIYSATLRKSHDWAHFLCPHGLDWFSAGGESTWFLVFCVF